METRHYLRALARAWYLVLGGTILGASLGYLYFLHATPRYSASTRLALGYSGTQLIDEADARVLAQIRANAFIQLASTPKVLAAAMAEAKAFGGAPAISASSNPTYTILTISVADDDPDTAARIANAYQVVLPSQLIALIGPTEGAVRLTTLSAATRPSAPFSPNRDGRLGVGLLLGFGLGCLAATLLDVTERSIRTLEEIPEATDLPVLGVIPRQFRSIRLPVLTHPTSRRADAYRHLKTSVLAVAQDATIIAVTSATAQEGKTSAVANLAVLLQRSGVRVIAVDADLRRARLSTTLGAGSAVGLTQVLAGRADLRDVIRRSDLTDLDVLPAGRPPHDPSEMIAGRAFAALLSELREKYDVVLVDTPPLLAATDGRLVARLADATLLVGRLGRVTPQQLRVAIASLDNAQVVGFVANWSGAGLGALWT